MSATLNVGQWYAPTCTSMKSRTLPTVSRSTRFPSAPPSTQPSPKVKKRLVRPYAATAHMIARGGDQREKDEVRPLPLPDSEDGAEVQAQAKVEEAGDHDCGGGIRGG